MPGAAGIALLATFIGLTGCNTDVDIPELVRTPELIGEVTASEAATDEQSGERRFVYRLEGTEVVDIDLNSAVNIGGGHEPQVGDLLLYGEEPEGPWFWSGQLRDDPVTDGTCTLIEGRAVEQGNSIVFEIGLRLPRAPDFDPAEQTDGEYTQPNRYFCINEHGEVTRYGA